MRQTGVRAPQAQISSREKTDPMRAAARIKRLQQAIASPRTGEAKRRELIKALEVERAKLTQIKEAMRGAGLLD